MRVEVATSDIEPRPRTIERVWTAMCARPLVSVFVAAMVVRVGFAVVSFVFHSVYLIPDETGYMSMAESISSGRGADAWYPGVGDRLFKATWVFSAPLALFFDVLWPSRLIGQLWAGLFGVGTAVLTTQLARQIISTGWAIGAGLMVALLPSQVLWSSVVLRESMVWFLLVVLALVVTALGRVSGWRTVALLAIALGSVVALGHLRQQTMVAASWALVAAAPLAFGRRRIALSGALATVALTGPAIIGLGIGGIDLVRAAAPTLNQTRTFLSVGASTAFTPTSVLQPGAATTTSEPGSGEAQRTTGAEAIARRATQTAVDSRGEVHSVVGSSDGSLYAFEDGLGANLRHLPRGLIATTLRPFPWEASGGARGLAAVESVGWYGLYALAAIGLAGAWRRRDVLAFPAVVSAMILAIGAVTQGNLGTAFRHRGQIFWVVAVLAALGAAQAVTRARRPMPSRSG